MRDQRIQINRNYLLMARYSYLTKIADITPISINSRLRKREFLKNASIESSNMDHRVRAITFMIRRRGEWKDNLCAHDPKE